MHLFRRLRFRKSENILSKVENSHLIKRYFLLAFAIFIYAVAYNLFFYKNNIIYGGASGVSILLKDYFNPSTFILVANILLLVLSYFTLGKKATINSLVGSLLFPLFIDLTKNVSDYIVLQNDNLLLISIIGGAAVGFSSGIVFKTGFTTGGTDILKQMISKYFKVSIGTSMLIVDGIIVLIGGFFLGWTRVLYAIIVLYIINIMVDKVVLGISSNKAVYITTTEKDRICDYLLNELNLGITLLETRGGYTYKKTEMIMCVVPTSDYFKVSEGISEIDPKAVILVVDAYQSYGIYGSKREVITDGIY